MDEVSQRRLLEELILKSREIQAAEAKEPEKPTDFLKGAFPAQIKFLLDDSQFKIGHCPRGAAKSYTAGLGLYMFMEKYPGCSVFYVTKTRDMARNIMWRTVMKQIAIDFDIAMEFNEGLLEGRHPNGSVFRLTGIDGDSRQQDKLLGGKYKLVILDEVAFFQTDLTEIIYKTIIPAAGRVAGSVWMMSTSSDYTRGLFFEATQPDVEKRTQGWMLHTWCWRDNPYIRDEMQATLDKLIAANPLIIHTNHFRQHYNNEWTIDTANLVYKYSIQRNLYYSDLPKYPNIQDWSYVLGIDLGWEDDNSFVLTAYHLSDPNLYVVKAFNQPHMTFDMIEAKTLEYLNDRIMTPTKIVIDGANKQGVESMRARTSIPFEKADKQGKVDFIEQMNGDFVQGKIKIFSALTNLTAELSTLLWTTEGGKIVFPKKERDGMPNHLCDALLYAWRMGYHFSTFNEPKKVVKGSKEWYLEQAENIWEREQERLQQESGANSEWSSYSGLGNLG